ncbi:MAG: aminotransferase class I/II-fold pyridoxal phosphate-dependent enzyme, partial [Pseudomonadota bacterium]
ALPDVNVDDPRVLRFRTFSKAHGLAALRVGYVLGEPSVVASFNRVRNHFGVNRLAQAAAMATLDDDEHLNHVIEDVAAARDRIAAIAIDNHLKPLSSATNFVAIDCGRDGRFARAILKSLERYDIFVRMPAVAPLDRCIRISAGLDNELDHLADILPHALSEASHAIGEAN